MAINFSGLASGIDTNHLIEQLMYLERQPIRNLQAKKALIERRQAAWGTVKSRLQDLQSKADNLRKPGALLAFKATSSSDTVAQVSAGSEATPGSYAVKVTALATAQSWASRSFATTNEALGLAGQLNVWIGSGDVTVVDVDAADSLEAIRDKLREALGSDANVAIVMTEPGKYSLTVTSTGTGTAAAVSIDGDVQDSDGGQLGLTITAQATDAVLTVNGLQLTRSSNTITDAVPGLTLTLGGIGETTVTVSHDTQAQTQRLKQFVDSYNALMSDLYNRMYVQAPTTADGQRATTDPLYGESALRQLQSDLRMMMTSPIEIDGRHVLPSEIGLSGVGWGAEGFAQGHLQLDADKLAKALQDNPDLVDELLGGDNGLATQLYSKLRSYTQFGGVISDKETQFQDEIRSVNERIRQMETRLEQREMTMRRQFTAFETVLASTQSQMAWLGQQLATLPGQFQR